MNNSQLRKRLPLCYTNMRQIGKGWFETKIDELCKWIETREEMFEKTQETVNVEIDRLKGNVEALEKGLNTQEMKVRDFNYTVEREIILIVGTTEIPLE